MGSGRAGMTGTIGTTGRDSMLPTAPDVERHGLIGRRRPAAGTEWHKCSAIRTDERYPQHLHGSLDFLEG